MAYSWKRGTGAFGSNKNNQSGRSFSGGDKPVLPFHQDSNPPSPLTPLPGETPHPGRTNLLKEAQKNSSKLPPPPKGPPSNKGGKGESSQPSSRDSSIPPSQAPSSTTGLPASKESSPGMAAASLLFQPPSATAQASTSAVNLDSPFTPKTPAETQELMEKAEALDDIQNVDASFYARDWTLPLERDSLEKRVKFYATRTNLKEYDVEDLGVPLDGSRLRFRVRQSLAVDLLDVMDEFESLLNRLRSLDPQHVNEPSWQADPTGAFIKVLNGARTFASINCAWKGLSGRFAQGLRVYGKYLTRAYAAYGAAEGEVPASPATTTTSVYREMERYPLAEEKIKFAFGAIPGLKMPLGFRASAAKKDGRDRFVEADMHELAPTPQMMSSFFPPREPEANPETLQYEGPRPYEYTRYIPADSQAGGGEERAEPQETGEGKGKKKERVTFQGEERDEDYSQWNYEPPTGTDTGYQYEFDLDHGTGYPETPAPTGRGHRGGRRTSIYSFFGAPTPSQTPFGQPVIPPPLPRGTSGQAPQRRRSGFVDVNRAFRAVGGAPPPDGDGGDEDGDDGNHDRGRRPLPDPPRGTGGGGGNGGPGRGPNGGGGGGGGPPPNPPNPPGPPGGPRGVPPHMRPVRPGQPPGAFRGAGGGPPGGPPGGGSSSAATRPLLPPYGNVLPTINPVLKSSDVPSWNGDKATAVAYFWRINRIARGGGHLPEALGYWLWQKLQEGSSIDLWYMTVTEAQKDWMQENSYNWTQGIADGYLGRRWVNKLASDFRQSSFRDDRKHRFESPLDYLNRRIMTARFLGYSEQGSQDELQLIIERIPTHWHLVLSTSTLQDTDELKERAIEFEHELVSGNRHSEEDLETSVASILRKYGISSANKTAGPSRPSFRKTALNAELNEEGVAEQQGSPETSDGGSSSDDEEGPWEEILAAAYSVVQKKAPPANKKYPFEKRNDVRTTAKKPPPAPCFACGSPYHWNRECPHRDEYQLML